MTATFTKGDRIRITRAGNPCRHQGYFGIAGDLGRVDACYGSQVFITLDRDPSRSFRVYRDRLELALDFEIGATVRCTRDVGGNSLFGLVGDRGVIKDIRPHHGIIQVHFTLRRLTSWVEMYRFEVVAGPQPVEAPKPAPKPTPAPEPKKSTLHEQLGGDFDSAFRSPSVTKTWIVTVVDKDGQPRPSAKPKTFVSLKQAETVAKIMAERHPGESFIVFQAISAAAKPKIAKAQLVRFP